MAPTNLVLPRVDTPPIENTNFPELFEQWLSILVDQLNTAMSSIETDLGTLDARLIALGG